MPRRKKKEISDRIFLREGRGYYLDLRDLGLGRPAIIDRERNEVGACQSFDRSFEIAKRMVALAGRDPIAADYAEKHLERKSRKMRPSTIARDRHSLAVFLDYLRRMLGREPFLSDITQNRVQTFMDWRSPQVASQTLGHELHAVSSMMKRAVLEQKATSNPVPTAKKIEEFAVVHSKPAWLGIGEAARLLRVAGEADAKTGRRGQRCPYLRPIIGYGLLTGARPNEIFGAQVSDVDFKNQRVHFRHNEWRLLKRSWHEGEVPLWPQLAEILENYIERWQPTDLLFPSHITGRMYTNINDALRVLFKKARIFKRPHLYITRHTYCATRLQTLDHGEAVSPYTVAKELRHKDLELIMNTYGHLQDDRQRLAVVEYREADVTELKRASGDA